MVNEIPSGVSGSKAAAKNIGDTGSFSHNPLQELFQLAVYVSIDFMS